MLQAILADWTYSTFLSGWTISSRMIAAAFFGAIIGFEREWRSRPAGLRTHILVCLAAAVVAILTIEISHMPAFENQATQVDPSRLIDAVTAGVAFLAAGTIIFARGEVHGLTTGAGMWAAGAVGLATGLGFVVIAAMATLLVLLVLAFLYFVESRYVADDDDKKI